MFTEKTATCFRKRRSHKEKALRNHKNGKNENLQMAVIPTGMRKKYL